MVTSRERIQQIAGQSRFTTSEGREAAGHIATPMETDERGVLKELSSHQIEKMGRDQVLDYQKRRNEQIEAKRAEHLEQADFERYQEAFVEAGGREKDAKGAWEAQKTLDASQAARTAQEAALHASQRHVLRGL